jgi:hypothetical protein
MNKKLKSFTLSEMLVVLIITAIVVGLAFSVLSLIRKQVDNLQSNTDKKIQLDLVKNKLFFDFNKFSNAYIADKSSYIVRSDMDSSIYFFTENLLISDNDDTLIKNLNDVKFFYKGNEVVIGRIDAIKLVIEEKKDIFTSIFVYKYNDATELNDLP